MKEKKISIPLLFGLIAAGIMVLVVIGTWLAGPEAFLGWQVWLGKSLVILLAAVAATAEKKARGGVLDFRSALRVAFGVMVMGIVAANLLVWLIVNVIDPHFYQRLLPVILQNAEQSYRRFGAPPDQIREQLEYIRTHNQFTAGSIIFGMGRDLLLFGIIAILIAVTVKTKKGPTPAPRQ
jgi:thiosulfate reductase cytochrome b subunit